MQKHSVSTDCWSVINGEVYNLTSWMTEHPGGDRAILGICGKDGSAAFQKKHEGQEKPNEVLTMFKIGTLSQ